MTKLEVTGPPAVADDQPSMIRRIVAGDLSLFEQLMRRYNRRLYRLARAALRV